jgi:hypothetical protein
LDAEAVEDGEIAEILLAYVFLLEDDSGEFVEVSLYVHVDGCDILDFAVP